MKNTFGIRFLAAVVTEDTLLFQLYCKLRLLTSGVPRECGSPWGSDQPEGAPKC